MASFTQETETIEIVWNLVFNPKISNIVNTVLEYCTIVESINNVSWTRNFLPGIQALQGQIGTWWIT